MSLIRWITCLLLALFVGAVTFILVQIFFDIESEPAFVIGIAFFVISAFVFRAILRKKTAVVESYLMGSHKARFFNIHRLALQNHKACADAARRRSRMRTTLNLCISLLTVLSGSVAVWGEQDQKHYAAVVAFISGLLNAVLNGLWNEKTTQQVAEGAGVWYKVYESASAAGNQTFANDGDADAAYGKVASEFGSAYTSYWQLVRLEPLT